MSAHTCRMPSCSGRGRNRRATGAERHRAARAGGRSPAVLRDRGEWAAGHLAGQRDDLADRSATPLPMFTTGGPPATTSAARASDVLGVDEITPDPSFAVQDERLPRTASLEGGAHDPLATSGGLTRAVGIADPQEPDVGVVHRPVAQHEPLGGEPRDAVADRGTVGAVSGIGNDGAFRRRSRPRTGTRPGAGAPARESPRPGAAGVSGRGRGAVPAPTRGAPVTRGRTRRDPSRRRPRRPSW